MRARPYICQSTRREEERKEGRKGGLEEERKEARSEGGGKGWRKGGKAGRGEGGGKHKYVQCLRVCLRVVRIDWLSVDLIFVYVGLLIFAYI